MMDARAGDLAPGGACCPAPAVVLPKRVDAALIQRIDDATGHLDFLVPDMHCAACLTTIEGRLHRLDGVKSARANLTTHRVGVSFDLAVADPDAVLTTIERLGYTARPFDAAALDATRDTVGAELVRSLAVAGFAAGNVMLLSVSVWSGAELATRDLFHWLSALIALPAIAYAGQPFFRSAVRGIAGGNLNMDVPISIGVVLTAAMSLYETAVGGEHAYFDAAITLLFFLLVGRYLDHRMRGVARSAAAQLMSLAVHSVIRLEADGGLVHVPIGEIAVGDQVRVAAGDRMPVDGEVTEGASDIDRSMLTGESDPEPIAPGGRVFAGTVNLTGPLTVRVTATTGDTLLAEITRLVAAAERGSGRYVRLADRLSRVYAPAVHLIALLTAIGWLAAGAGWHASLTTAVAVLIITCPCALGLAVPAVQVVASGFLLARGVMLKDGAALEQAAGIDMVVFDKTGTLTKGEPRLADAVSVSRRDWAIAAGLGAASRHPMAQALAIAAREAEIAPLSCDRVAEHPGNGMSGWYDGEAVRLGRLDWVCPAEADQTAFGSTIWLKVGDEPARRFSFVDQPRDDAAEIVAALQRLGIRIALSSGDRPEAVAALAGQLGIDEWRANQRPADKAAFIAAAEAEGRRVLMVGDGINDAPALAAATVSMSPGSAADISQNAAGIVFTGKKLFPVVLTVRLARAAQRLTTENFALAVLYNLIAVPIAVSGFVTPLIAAIAMSTSSIIVTANALRLPLLLPRDRHVSRVPAARRNRPYPA